jgi:hypothetical protein
MYRAQVITFQAASPNITRAVEEATERANVFLAETPLEDILNYHVQTVYEPPEVLDGSRSPEYYNHLITIVYRARRDEHAAVLELGSIASVY